MFLEKVSTQLLALVLVAVAAKAWNRCRSRSWLRRRSAGRPFARQLWLIVVGFDQLWRQNLLVKQELFGALRLDQFVPQRLQKRFPVLWESVMKERAHAI